ncbi:MAG: DNA gyrase subunit A [Planctomyces sp.]|nr:DNA gyrase subunit A [Planctomyces sp.]MBA4039077.1 DNA gyrase subunit A [Planctomyces sp.]MBA4119496.1 DNA gyrase subunit A [Isosphaera sp.]
MFFARGRTGGTTTMNMYLRSTLHRHPDASDAGGGAPESPAHGVGRVVDLQIERELQDSYLTYAMSTIMDRALPDVRDGLKPSQRRILVVMNGLNLRPGSKHIKCAKITGDTSGDYHPHGTAVIYPTLVNMGQAWRMRVTLIDPQGNFGSIAPDPPAAERYTEARMTHAAAEMLEDLRFDTVDFQPTYDDRNMEPTVLPGKFPYLLVNGGVGIAVGMATSLAPNNPTEVLDAIVRVIENPGLTLLELMQDVTDEAGRVVRRGIKGPDFPTGGVVLGRGGVIEAYETGRGRLTLRGVVRTEPIEGTKDRQQLVIEQIPFNLGLDTLIERIKDAADNDKITDIAEARNESNDKSPVRVVIELKKGADAGVVERQLYEYTPLQHSFSVQSLALVNRQPRQLSLRQMIDCYIEHRVSVIRRRTAFLLMEARRRAHLLEGLILAVCAIDEVIRVIRASRTRQEAIEALTALRLRIPAGHPAAAKIPERFLALVRQAGEAGVALTRVQAESIGNMRLIQLTGLELERIAEEYAARLGEIDGHERVLASQREVLDMIVRDCDQMRARHDSPRLTRVEEAQGDELTLSALIPVQDMAVTISHQGYAKRVVLETYRQQSRGGKGVIANRAKDEDFTEHLFVASTHDDLLCFTSAGRVFRLKVYQLPEMDRTAKGRSLANLVDLRPGERARAFLAVRGFEESSQYLTFVSRRGLVKRTPLKDYRNVHAGGLIAVDIRQGDALLDVLLTTGGDDLLIVAASGVAIRFPEDDVRLMGRNAGGVRGIDLADDDGVVGIVGIPMRPDADGDPVTADASLTLLTITEMGFGKRTLVDEYRVQPEAGKARSQSRGGKGRADIRVNDRNGRSVAALGLHDHDDLVVVTRMGQLVRMPAAQISAIGRGTQGVRVVALNEGDAVIAAARVPGEQGGGPAGPLGPATSAGAAP